MSLIINIDTAVDTASVCLAKNEEIVALAINENQKNQAGWLHQAIDGMLKKNNFKPNQLDAVAVSIGPGSYTGLRVGLSAAKGLCYALHIPLITVSSLKIIAFGVRDQATALICPMIDARRMEVFTALYNKDMEEKMPAHPLIINETSFTDFLPSSAILFCGNGSKKLQPLISNSNASFSDSICNASHLSALSQNYFIKKEFADLAYTEPLYIKEFYSPARKT